MAEISLEESLSDIFRPPPGGDVTLQSKDGIEFLVHSVILGIASSVFASLLVVGTKKDVVELSEDADTVSLMLQFIYPNISSPSMTSFEMLSRCLCAARKYDLTGIIQTLDKELSTNTTAPSLILLDPLRVHQLALEFSLPRAQATAAPLVLTDKVDVCDPLNISALIKSHPPASLIRLAAIQGTRAKILADALLLFGHNPILPTPNSPGIFHDLSCEPCRKRLDECQESSDETGFYHHGPPSWFLAWATLVYQTLLATPLDKSDHLFDVIILDKFTGSTHVCQDCLKDFWEFRRQRDSFNEWAQRIKGVLKQRLQSLRPLYEL